MGLPNQPVTLTAEQVAELYQQLRDMRHTVNGKLAVVQAAAELIQLKPEQTQSMLKFIREQPQVVAQALVTFSAAFETTLGLNKVDNTPGAPPA